jgi:outer membrane protein OmpA-like peptidoglycan-associated protein
LHKPVVLRASSANPDGTDVPAVEHLIDTNFLWAYGLTERLQFSVVAPVTTYQTGTGLSAYQSAETTSLPKTEIRDLRFGAAYAIQPRDRVYPGSGMGLTARLDLSVPTGNEEHFAGDRSVVVAPSLSTDYRRGRLFAGLQVGARFRAVTQLGGTRMGSQALTALGLGFDVLPNEKLSVALEAYALPVLVGQQTLERDPTTREIVTSSSSRLLIPAEWMTTVRTAPTPGGDFSFSLSGGTAIPIGDSAITAPQFRIVAGLRYAPLGRDSDGDRVLDKDDLCPNEAEDHDGYLDEDGCIDADNDKDGIPDNLDRCRDKPEDKDGFQDDDGCPDLDDDNDGIPDTEDQCRFKPEDKDGYQDDDGCPDEDNDDDGIPDISDACPNAAEDKDGYNDKDGCPDPDNDADGILDAQDKCPLTAEDKDGYQDDDGCPEPDNDFDGILDAQDKCPLQAETINGIDDDDGCPEPNAQDLTVMTGAVVSVVKPLRFPAGQAKLSPEMRKQVLMIAQRARGQQPLRTVIVQAFADTTGENDRNEKLADERANAIRTVLVEAGIEAGKVTAAVGDLKMRRAPTSPQYEVMVQRGTFK